MFKPTSQFTIVGETLAGVRVSITVEAKKADVPAIDPDDVDLTDVQNTATILFVAVKQALAHLTTPPTPQPDRNFRVIDFQTAKAELAKVEDGTGD